MKVILFLALAVGICIAVAVIYIRSESSPSEMGHEETYGAAVVDYHPLDAEVNVTIQEYMLTNAKEYVSFIKQAKKLDTDIIVFPECGLAGFDTQWKSSPEWKLIDAAVEIPPLAEPFESKRHVFTSSQKVLEVLSNAAKENSMYVVVNLPEKVNCSLETDCPPDQLIFYNSNIVFNRHGCIISRYRKYNLYGEAFSVEKEAHVCTFETDFNVTFGMFICFDIMFGNPSQRLISEKGVSNIIFSSAWFSELPFLTATEVQAGWAHSMNANFLASGFRNPATGSGGSGIYNGSDGVLAISLPLREESELIFAKVPIKPIRHTQTTKSSILSYSSVHDNIGNKDRESDSDRQRTYVTSTFFGNLLFKKDPSLINMSSELLEPDSLDSSLPTYSYHKYDMPGFTSSIHVKWRLNAPLESSTPRYRMVSFNDLRPFDVRNESVSVCGIVACANETIDSCGDVPNIDSLTKTTFESIELIVNSNSLTLGYLPITMDFDLKPLPASTINFSKEFLHSTPVVVIKMTLIKPVENLFAFGIYKVPN